MLGRSSFPPIGELPYLLTLAPRGFFWFQLIDEAQREPAERSARSSCSASLPIAAGLPPRSATRKVRTSRPSRMPTPSSSCVFVEVRFSEGMHETYLCRDLDGERHAITQLPGRLRRIAALAG